jgi:hypothetical protein
MENTIASASTSSGWGHLQAHISAGKGETNKQDALTNINIAGNYLNHQNKGSLN